MKKKKLGSSTSFVHGKEKEIICHDMRKYVWQNYDFLQNVKKKNEKGLIVKWISRRTTDSELGVQVFLSPPQILLLYYFV